jgi:hypothetical protein
MTARRRSALASAFSVLLASVLASREAWPLDAGSCVRSADSAQQLRLAGKLLAAQEQLVACADPGCPPVVRVACSEWLNDIRKSIPSVVLAAKESVRRCGGEAAVRDVVDVDVQIDGRLLARRLDGRAIAMDPGTHVLRFELRDGAAPREETIVLREGEKLREVNVVLETRVSEPCGNGSEGAGKSSAGNGAEREHGSPTLTGAYIASTVSLLSLGGFAFFAASSHAKYRDLVHTCGPYCSSQQSGPFLLEQDVADVCLGVGLASAALAVWLFLIPRNPRVALEPSTRGGALRFSF